MLNEEIDDVPRNHTLSWRDRMRLAGTLALACLAFDVAVAEPANPVCAEFRALLDRKEVLARYQLQTSAQPGDEEQYYNLDIDGDDANDVVKGGCSSSLQPADPCILLIDFASGNHAEFTFDIAERFFLLRHRAKIYAIATNGTSGKRSILTVDSSGINRICNGL